MSEISERFRKLVDGFTRRVEAVPEDKWSAQSPCEEWTARDVVEHMIGNCRTFLGFVGQELPEKSTEDLLAAWKEAAGAVQAALDDDAVATKEFQGFAGPTNLNQATERFLFTDLVVHAWDLARATGGDEKLPVDEVRAAHRQMEEMGDMLRSPGAAGPEIQPEEGADEQTRLLNFMGRKP